MRTATVDSERLALLGCPVDPARVTFALTLADGGGGAAFGREAFDSDVFGLEIGRLLWMRADCRPAYDVLLAQLEAHARSRRFDQILCRVPLEDRLQLWALTGAGYETMDVGLTFARPSQPGPDLVADDELTVRRADGTDVDRVVAAMAAEPWGSRYESDPTYTAAQVAELRRRWFHNSHAGRAAAFFVGLLEGDVAGYVICLLDGQGHGEIDLVGTSPAFRGRGVASRTLAHALAWFATVSKVVTVRTQASNTAAASLYESAGFRLSGADMTLRRSLVEGGAA